jgi:formylglycine-generating enzyme required for sulfatase activity
MNGNVWQWVEDCWHDSYAGAPADGSAWSPANCPSHVQRGGSFAEGPLLMRTAARRFGPKAEYVFQADGFRVARSLD